MTVNPSTEADRRDTPLQPPIIAADAPGGGGGKRRREVPVWPFTFAAVIGLWSLLTYGGLTAASVLPAPSALAAHFWVLMTRGYLGVPLWFHALASLERTVIGFGLAVVIGVPLGLAMGSYRLVDKVLRPLLGFVRPIPPIAFIPLAILYLGLGELPKILLIFYAAFIFIIVNTEAGARSTPELLARAARSMGLSRTAVFWRVVIPSSLPSIMSGIRVALAVSWGVVVAAELIAAQSGLGYMIQNAGTLFDLKTVYVGIISIGVLGLAMDSAVLLARKRLLHWEGK